VPHEGGRRKQVRAPRRHHDLGGLSSWPLGLRVDGLSLASGGFQDGEPACPPSAERHAQHASPARRRDACATPATEGTGAEQPLRVHLGTRFALHHGRLCQSSSGLRQRPRSRSRSIRTCHGTPAASSWRTTATTPVTASLSRPQEHPAHGSIYGTGADPVQELLEILMPRLR
jgi:hypothetical protein